MILRRTAAAVLLTCAATLLAGCTQAPPEPQASPTPHTADTSSAPSGAPDETGTPGQPTMGGNPPTQPILPTAQATPGAQQTLASCGGKPTASEVITVLRQQNMIARDGQVQVTTGPLCAQDWQYTVVSIPNTDPLQVVTRLTNGKLTLITAGTDICGDLLTPAPLAIRTTAHCLSG